MSSNSSGKALQKGCHIHYVSTPMPLPLSEMHKVSVKCKCATTCNIISNKQRISSIISTSKTILQHLYLKVFMLSVTINALNHHISQMSYLTCCPRLVCHSITKVCTPAYTTHQPVPVVLCKSNNWLVYCEANASQHSTFTAHINRSMELQCS